MKGILPIFASTLLLSFPIAVQADHPGADLDVRMHEKEKFFEIVDKPSAPSFELADANGNLVHLSDFSDKIVVLNFIFASCAGVCPLHSERIAEIQKMINTTPMKDRVQFISITTDAAHDTPDVLKTYGSAHGLDGSNWMFLTKRPEQGEDATRQLAQAYGLRFEPLKDGQQMHAVVTHIIDRNGRFAAKFHGLKFDPVNAVLYVNGLTNNHGAITEREPGWWQSVKELFN
jgi:protein SCO1/2